MFIATSRHPKDLAPLEAKPGSGTIDEQVKAVALPRSFGVKKGPPSYKHLAPDGAKRQTMFGCIPNLNSRFAIARIAT